MPKYELGVFYSYGGACRFYVVKDGREKGNRDMGTHEDVTIPLDILSREGWRIVHMDKNSSPYRAFLQRELETSGWKITENAT